MLALIDRKQASQRWQSQSSLTLRQTTPDDANGLPVVVMPVAGAAFEAELTQAAQGVAFCIGLPRGQGFLGVIRRVEHAPLFHGGKPKIKRYTSRSSCWK